MIQSIYTEVSNGNKVCCGRRVPKYEALPIPLMKSNYLGEFRTLLEKAKARKNLGIGDEYSLSWGNITGHIEDNADLVRFIEQQWKYEYISPYIQLEITNVKQALDYALYYVSTFEANDQLIRDLSHLFDELNQHFNQVQETLLQGINDNANDIDSLEHSIDSINEQISAINDALRTINVDLNIENWINDNLQKSKTIEFLEQQDEEGGVTFKIIEVKISNEAGNALEVKGDGLYTKSYDDDIRQVNQSMEEIEQKQYTIDQSLANLKYHTELPDSATSPVHEGITVEQLKNKTMSEILDEVLFPAEVRQLVEPALDYTDIEQLVEINSPVYYPQLEYLAGDAGDTISTTNVLTFNGIPYGSDYYDRVGTFLFTATVTYDDGEYLVNNRGETTTYRVQGGQIVTTKQVKVTYPWYAGSTEEGVIKQELVPIDEPSGILDFSLNRHAVIKIPGANSRVSSFRLDSGLGYLDVDMDGWTYSTETINDIPYKVWTKIDSYAAVLPHRINFTIVL